MSSLSYPVRYRQLRTLVDRRLTSIVRPHMPRHLTEGCRYVLSAGGKRVRSMLVLLSAEAVGGRADDALDAAAATEIMHNFTLVHDDIMDHAATRRNRPTVHVKWDVNYALLVGDVLLGLAYRSLAKTKTSNLRRIVDLFTAVLLEVCEGQALDLVYEQSKNVTLRKYFAMIEKKTARLFSMSTELGGLAGGGTTGQVDALRRFGHHLGRAFQVQDDLLDVTANKKEFGKNIGGDIMEGKKTFLLLTALEHTTGREKELLLRLLNRPRRIRRSTVARITSIYKNAGTIDAAREQIRRDTHKARIALGTLPRNEATDMLHWFSGYLLTRVS